LLKDDLRRQGAFLFRWRSYLPLLLLPVALTAASQSGSVERLFGPHWENVWEIFCAVISFAGLGVRALTVGFVPTGTSGRNTHGQVADVLNTSGMYSIVRNPLYLGNFLMLLGCAMLPGIAWFVVVTCTFFALYYERIIYTEETFLQEKFGDAYTTWASRTPAFFPNRKLWRAPEMQFSWLTVLRREYSGLYAIATALAAIVFACDMLGEREPVDFWLKTESGWLWLFVSASIVYLVLRTLKRNTNLLSVEGR
jgi:protein-S-isoprenylcysteine O-methyltransferase Ste14